MERTLRQPPPRHLDPVTHVGVLLGGFHVPFGLFFVLIGSIFAWVFGAQSELRFWLEAPGAVWLSTTATVTATAPTSMSENEQTIWRYQYAYTIDDVRYQGEAYGFTSQILPGNPLPVEYQSRRPERSRAVGLRRASFSAWVVFVFIFPLLGLGFVAYGMWRNFRFHHLLQHGQFTRATLRDTQPTNTRINNQTVYRFTFDFEVGGRPYTAVCLTHHTESIGDEEKEMVLYRARQPEVNVVYDAFAHAPAIDGRGQLQPLPLRSLWPLALLLLVVAENLLLAQFFW